MTERPDLVDELTAARVENEQLRRALESRQVIGIAQGLLMQRYGIGVQTAFEYLARRSQDENIKLRDLARIVVTELGAEASRRTGGPGPTGVPPTRHPAPSSASVGSELGIERRRQRVGGGGAARSEGSGAVRSDATDTRV